MTHQSNRHAQSGQKVYRIAHHNQAPAYRYRKPRTMSYLASTLCGSTYSLAGAYLGTWQQLAILHVLGCLSPARHKSADHR